MLTVWLGRGAWGGMDGVQAMEAFSYFRPELILTDVTMSEMGCFELCRRVRRESPGVATPFIFISARAIAWAVEQVAGNNSTYSREPFGLEGLLEAVRKLWVWPKTVGSMRQFATGRFGTGNGRCYTLGV
jgi:CheY-like chemotaxis protein